MSHWTSAHLEFEEPRGDVYGVAADRVVGEAVAPLVTTVMGRGWAQRWFFLRYLDDGPHVRLRFEGVRKTLERHVEPRLAALASDTGAVRRVRFVPYEPEIERYGGPEATRVAEDWFHASSEAALGLLTGLDPADRAARLGRGLLAFLVLLHTFLPRRRDAAALAADYGRRYLLARVPDPERRRGWSRAFAEGYERQAERLATLVDTVWRVLDGGGEPPEEIVEYRRALDAVRRRLIRLERAGRLITPIVHIVPSYLHLMSNRLGVSIPEEMYLATLVHRTLFPDAGRPDFRRETVSSEISNMEGKETRP